MFGLSAAQTQVLRILSLTRPGFETITPKSWIVYVMSLRHNRPNHVAIGNSRLFQMGEKHLT